MEDKKKILQTKKRSRFFVLFQSLLVIIKDEKNNSSFLRSQVGVVICQDDFTERLRWNYSREILASSNTDCSLACNYLGFKIDFIFHRSIFCFVEFGSILDRKKIRMAASKNIGGLGVSTCESSRSNASSLLQGQGRDELSITKLIFPCAATPTWIVIKKRYPKIIVLLFFPSSSYINSTVNIFVDDKKLSTFKEKLIKLYLEQLWRIILAIKAIK